MENDNSSLLKNSMLLSTGFRRSGNNNINNNNNTNVHLTYTLNTSLNTDTVKILNCLRTQNTQNNNASIKEYTYDDIKGICMRVFMNYAMPKNGQFFLSYHSLFKILRNSNILNDQTFPLKEADIIAQKIIKGNRDLTSDDFLNYLAIIAARLDNEYYQDRKESMINFIKTYLEPLSMRMETGRKQMLMSSKSTQNDDAQDNKSLNNSLNFQKFIDSFILDENVYLVLTSIAPALKQIYTVYFHYENANQHDMNKIEKGSYQNYLQFCKDFEISPYLINNRLLALYWGIMISTPLEQLINNTSIPFEKFNEQLYNIGVLYTFPKFLLLFAHVSSFYYNTTDLSEGKRMLYLIEKMHESNGYTNLNKKASIPFNRKHSIIPPKEIIMILDSSLINEKDDFDNFPKVKESQNWINELKGILLLNNETFNAFEPYIDQLKDYYRIYSQYGDKMNYAKMTFSNYQKILYDGGIMEHSCKTNIKNNLSISRIDCTKTNKSLSKFHQSSKNPIKTLSKTMSEPLYKDATTKRQNDLSMTLSRICLSLGKDRDKLDETDLNMIFSKLTGNINFNRPRESKITLHYSTLEIKKIYLDSSHYFNITEAKAETPMRLSFFLFIKSFVLLAQRLFPSCLDKNEAIRSFLLNIMEGFLLKLEAKNSSTPKEKEEIINILTAIAENEGMLQLMKDIKPLLYSHYQHYMETDKAIRFESFFRFYKDFEIYPYWISLCTLKDIFFTCVDKEVTLKSNCALNSSQYIKVIKEEKLSFESFNESIIICSFYMKIGDDMSWCDKVLFLLDKMFISGGQRSLKRSGKNCTSKKDFSYHERLLIKKYPEYYRRKYGIVDRNIRLENKHAFDEVFFE